MMDRQFPIGQRIELPGHFAEPVLLDSVRSIGRGVECRVRLPDGTLEEVVLSEEETLRLAAHQRQSAAVHLVEPTQLQLLVESARIRLAYAHAPQFAVSLSGIRTLPHQIEAVYQRMLPQPNLRFLLADDPGAGKTIMAGLLLKELKLREAAVNPGRLDEHLEQSDRVGPLKLGFDLCAPRATEHRSGATEVRRIEVKGYTRGADIQLTTNEWYKAQQLGSTYWLCVVWDPLEENHELVSIQNPAHKLDHAKKEIVAARMFCIPAEAIATAAQ